MGEDDETLPPCAKCGREITSHVESKFQYKWIEVRDMLTDEIRYYHHHCYNTKGR